MGNKSRGNRFQFGIRFDSTLVHSYSGTRPLDKLDGLEGWQVNDIAKDQVRLLSQKRGVGVRILAYSNTATLESYVTGRISVLMSTYPDYQELSRRRFMLPSGLPAYAIDHRLTLPQTEAPGRTLSVFTVKGERKFEVKAGTWNASRREEFRAQLERMAYSLGGCRLTLDDRFREIML